MTIDPKHLPALIDACHARYNELNVLLSDNRIPLEARQVIQRMANDIMKAWEALPTKS